MAFFFFFLFFFSIGSQSAPICFHCCWARTSTGKVGNGTGPVRQRAFLSRIVTRDEERLLCKKKSFDLALIGLDAIVSGAHFCWVPAGVN